MSLKFFPLQFRTAILYAFLCSHKRKCKVAAVHAMKISRGSRGKTPLILNLGFRWRQVVKFTPRERTRYPLNGGVGWAPEPVWAFPINERPWFHFLPNFIMGSNEGIWNWLCMWHEWRGRYKSIRRLWYGSRKKNDHGRPTYRWALERAERGDVLNLCLTIVTVGGVFESVEKLPLSVKIQEFVWLSDKFAWLSHKLIICKQTFFFRKLDSCLVGWLILLVSN
jgi:hypothetical protein